MELFKSFDRGYRWARVDAASARISPLSMARCARLALRDPDSQGWYSTLGDSVVAFGMHAGRPHVWIDDRAEVVDEGLSAVVFRWFGRNRLVLIRDGAEIAGVAYKPGVAEEGDFGVWLALRLRDRERSGDLLARAL